MEKTYHNLAEKMIHLVTTDGLRVFLNPRPSYHRAFASLTTRFGALTQSFQVDGGKEQRIPAGTAHFLEHKMFDKADGDVLNRFSALGADANAFTNNQQTSYTFSTSQRFPEALTLLLEFVQQPYFTEAKVKREVGIIAEEIRMYADNPEWQLYQGLLATIYPNSALATDIAGSVASIQTISPALLYDLHQAFYQPDHLTLTVSGNFNPAEAWSLIQTVQAKLKRQKVRVQASSNAPQANQGLDASRSMGLNQVKTAWGLRLPAFVEMKTVRSQRIIAVDLLLDLLFGEQTDWYQSLYEAGILDLDFDYEYSLQPNYQFITFFSESKFSEKLRQAIQERLLHYAEVLQKGRKEFESLKVASLGESIQSLNSLEEVATGGDESLCGATLFDKIEMIRNVQYDQIVELAQHLFKDTHLIQYQLTN
ncbi:EF-P 5-aminopentanol modification-associated protein YfmH [Eupransor demetentiae]|uniref:M16 family (PqqL) n=1 Tax=Eupransor demetentiae TaxID=3109584 RepID=A0ABM9N542_9LACO|nr:M16 family (PqqL) [Lactobacillaceae bacterium LMG 33000]